MLLLLTLSTLAQIGVTRHRHKSSDRMRARIPNACSRLTAGVFFVLLGYGIFAPSVRAGCGDHVVPNWSSIDLPSLGSASGGANIESDVTKRIPNFPQAPCSGPHCSHRPFQFPLAPSVPEPEHIQDWFCLLNPPVIDPENQFHSLFEPSALPLSSLSDSIFHPPR